MNATSKTKFLAKLRNKEYRDSYVSAFVTGIVPQQIRILREQRGWTQSELGERIGKPQNAISRLENTEYGKQGIQTLLELASVFDVGLVIKFVPFSRFLCESENLSAEKLSATSFEHESESLEALARNSFTSGWQTADVPVQSSASVPVLPSLFESANESQYTTSGRVVIPYSPKRAMA